MNDANEPQSIRKKSLLFRLCDYWFENAKIARDWHENGLLLCAIILGIIRFVCWFSNLDKPWTGTIETVSEDGAIILSVFWCLIWLPFRRHEAQREKSNVGKNLLVEEIRKLQKQIDDDSIKLEITSSLALEHTTTLHGLLTVKALNVGQKIARIRRVAILLNPTSTNFPGGTLTPVLSELNIGQKQAVVQIQGQEDMHEWQQVLNHKPDFLVHERDGDKYGNGYIELTSCKKIDFEFFLLPDEAWRGLGFRGPPNFQ